MRTLALLIVALGLIAFVPNAASDDPAHTTCDLVRGTGGQPRISVNPVLGLITVDPGCLQRWLGCPLGYCP